MTIFIAEAGVNHNGQEDLALKLIDAASAAGADIVKFQTFKAKNLVTSDAILADYQRANIVQNNSISNNVILNSNDQMKFDKKIIKVNSSEKVTLTLNHTGRFPVSSMGHNFVLLKKGVDVNNYALKAAGARNSEYIPDGDNELAYTKMLGGGESDTITFDAPEPGTYIFICSLFLILFYE